MKAILSILALALLALATTAWAGDDCHIPGTVPVVTNWTITAGPGLIVIDATLAGESWCPPSEYYQNRRDGYDGSWDMGVSTRQPDSAYFDHGNLDLSKAIVTDSTFHAEVPHDAGTFYYYACVGGTANDAQECSCPYKMEGAITILPGKTPARRVSLGSLKAYYR